MGSFMYLNYMNESSDGLMCLYVIFNVKQITTNILIEKQIKIYKIKNYIEDSFTKSIKKYKYKKFKPLN